MDMAKIGAFLQQLRNEQNLTQEQLGQKLGVTNKTVSRWETGTYLPPVEMLQLMSNLYDVSINEILCGQRLAEESYKQAAEENLTVALGNSVFTLKEKKYYFAKKWRKDHCFELVAGMLFFIAAIVLCAIFFKDFLFVAVIVSFIWVLFTNNRRDAYVESMICPDPDEK